MPSRALVTGGGRGIGAGIARALAANGWAVTVTGRTADQVEAIAAEIGGKAVVGDVSKREDVERMLDEAGPIDLLVANAGVAQWEESWETDPDAWWHVLEVNVRGVYLTTRLALPGMVERGGGRIVITGSGSSYLPGSTSGAYSASKAAVGRYGEVLAKQVEPHGVKVFVISPGLVRTEMTSGFGDDLPWTPPECAPALVRALVSGEFDVLAGRYLHAEHDPPESLRPRIAEIEADDLNAIRLRR
jgi:3-oxoacyl-[acyl-carrier protein] reductase